MIHCGLKPWELAKLTDRQIMSLYNAPRDEEGKVVPVQEKPKEETLAYHLMQVDLLVANGVIKPDEGEEAKKQVRIKWQQKKSTS